VPSRRGWLALALAFGCSCASAVDYVALPGGRFESALPQGAASEASVPVDVAAFELRVTPVTGGEFLDFVRTHSEWQRGRVPAIFAERSYLIDWRGTLELDADASEQPLVHVSWFAAKAFCESEGARLPTWLEWEYAAAADETRRDARADPQWRRRILAWYERPTASSRARVGGPPNVYGVRDLHGLVWEWVDDFNALFIAGDSRTQGDPDTLKFCGSGAISVLDRDNYAVLMRIALLSSLTAADTTGNLGFRCARAPDRVHR
jgi:formylglycine-generating enzyme required for sulfatase activity